MKRIAMLSAIGLLLVAILVALAQPGCAMRPYSKQAPSSTPRVAPSHVSDRQSEGGLLPGPRRAARSPSGPNDGLFQVRGNTITGPNQPQPPPQLPGGTIQYRYRIDPNTSTGFQTRRTYVEAGGFPQYAEAPHIDLQSVLQGGGRAGGGAGQSPFRDPALKPSTLVIDPGVPGFGRAVGPHEFTLRPGEELWVIERRVDATLIVSDDMPGCGALVAHLYPAQPAPAQPAGLDDSRAYAAELLAESERLSRGLPPQTIVPVPLKHTDVDARIDGYISTVRVTQQFENPFSHTIEAVYVFPLPEDAAVSDFLMTIGDRRIRGVIREREQARQVYEEARRQGYTASLLTQERPNIFTQHVANIEPGRAIDITMTYFNCLAYHDGWFEWVFPMVVGPRFNPPYTKNWKPFNDGVGAVEAGAPGISGQQTEVQYLRPHERSGHDIGVRLAIDAGVPIESIECRSHQVNVHSAHDTPHLANVVLSSLDSIPNKDFVLRYRVAGSSTKSAMLTQVTEKGGFFTLMLVPPADLQYIERGPIEMVFVIDCSGSMQGEPLEQAKRAATHALRNLRPEDSFQVINFSDSSSALGHRALDSSWENVRRGIAYVEGLQAGGGTQMIHGLRAALGFPHDPRHLRFVCFLTDGYIGNEAEILAELKKGLGEARVFSMGMGSSPNRYLMDEMAKLGRGATAYIGLGDDAASVMGMFLDRAAHAALTDIRIDWGGLAVDEVFPARMPDLFVGRPLFVTGRFRGSGATTVQVTGRAGARGERIPIMVPVAIGDDAGAARGSLATVWARQKIAGLTRRTVGYESPVADDQVLRTALDFALMSPFTSFVAVDSLTRTAGPIGATVEVPVPIPEGTNYSATVQERPRPRYRAPGDDGP